MRLSNEKFNSFIRSSRFSGCACTRIGDWGKGSGFEGGKRSFPHIRARAHAVVHERARAHAHTPDSHDCDQISAAFQSCLEEVVDDVGALW